MGNVVFSQGIMLSNTII